jgi:hypothetical protein
VKIIQGFVKVKQNTLDGGEFQWERLHASGVSVADGYFVRDEREGQTGVFAFR